MAVRKTRMAFWEGVSWWSFHDPALKDETYTTTWFDMFRSVNGKIVEHFEH